MKQEQLRELALVAVAAADPKHKAGYLQHATSILRDATRDRDGIVLSLPTLIPHVRWAIQQREADLLCAGRVYSDQDVMDMSDRLHGLGLVVTLGEAREALDVAVAIVGRRMLTPKVV